VCQICGAGGPEVNFDLWRQLTVERLIGESQGGYLRQIDAALKTRLASTTGLRSPAIRASMILRDEALHLRSDRAELDAGVLEDLLEALDLLGPGINLGLEALLCSRICSRTAHHYPDGAGQNSTIRTLPRSMYPQVNTVLAGQAPYWQRATCPTFNPAGRVRDPGGPQR
jgi:hypothetical protein